MCPIKENQRPLDDVIGSLSPFISTKMLVVIHVDCVWTKVDIKNEVYYVTRE